MATFGSYGNLGGELVNVVEINSSLISVISPTATLYTCPSGRYALVILRNFSLGSLTSIQFNYSASLNFVYQQNTNYNESTMKDKILNEGEDIVLNRPAGAIASSAVNFLIFEYRKP